jgi:hypothetical protein
LRHEFFGIPPSRGSDALVFSVFAPDDGRVSSHPPRRSPLLRLDGPARGTFGDQVRRRFFVLLLLSVFVACGGSSLKGSVYRGDGLAFRLGETPSAWRRITVTNTRLAFRDEQAEATILVNGRCGKDGDDVPLLALTQHLFMNFTEREILEQTVVPMDGREAMHTVMRAKLDGVPKFFNAYVLKKDGCVYDLVGIWAVDKFEPYRAAFEGFAAGFHTQSEKD